MIRTGTTRIDVVSPANIVTDPAHCQLVPAGAPLAASFVEQHLSGHDPSPVARGVYRETSASDGVFIVDHLPATVPGHHNVAVAVTGWGSGFAPILGEILKDLVVEGSTARDIARFAMRDRCLPATQQQKSAGSRSAAAA